MPTHHSTYTGTDTEFPPLGILFHLKYFGILFALELLMDPVNARFIEDPMHLRPVGPEGQCGILVLGSECLQPARPVDLLR